MAKKRKAPRQAQPTGPREVDSKDASLRINTYEDVADSEEEHFINQDRIDFDDERRSKRIRRQEREEDFLDASDEEILAQDDSESDDDEDDHAQPQTSKPGEGEWEEEGEEEEGEGDEGFWGSSKKDYYNADHVQTEADALEEEQEALRIQAKKLAKMSEADFLFDESEWLQQPQAGAATADGSKGDVVTEVLKEVEITDDMGPEERHKLLRTRYPEFDLLIDEFRELQPRLEEYQTRADGKPARSLEVIQYWVLGSYVATLASYFAILTSPARDTEGSFKTIDPAELRDHEIMTTLMECRETWFQVRGLKTARDDESGMLSPPDEDGDEDAEDDEMDADLVAAPKKTKKELAAAKAARKAAAEKARKAKSVEASLADLSTLLENPKALAKPGSKSKSKATKAVAVANGAEDDQSDFGEEDTLDARTASDKAKRKKSLRFYTSQIVQKANRRAEAGRDAGGDLDIPHRERLRDRQARLNREAERRGQKGVKDGADLGDDSGGEDDGQGAALAKNMRDAEDLEYYDMVAHASHKKKEDKKALHTALEKAAKGDRVVEQETVGADGKRKITYTISKNKGLTPARRRKDKGGSNPRLKKRLKYREKQIKLKSMKPVFSGGEAKGGYQGETSGIKTGLIKSVKL